MKTNKDQEKDLLNKIQKDNNIKKKALKKIIKALGKKNNNNHLN